MGASNRFLAAKIATSGTRSRPSRARLRLSASADPGLTMKRLLEDLDLVLAQIKQYVTRGTNNPEDLDLIEQSIIKRGVINKLRGAVPARNVPAGI